MSSAPSFERVECLPAGVGTHIPEGCEGVLSIFAGGVYWETLEEFWNHMESDEDRYKEHRIERLLELRAYAANAELHLWRSTIAPKELLCGRLVKDEGISEEYYSKEEHLLDIDEKMTKDRRYVTTGGGEYELPGPNYIKVEIRNYITYDDDGLGQITDFRIVGLVHKG